MLVASLTLLARDYVLLKLLNDLEKVIWPTEHVERVY